MSKETKVTVENGEVKTPDHVTIPFIEGDGTGPDIWAASSRVLEAAVKKAYDGDKSITWKEVLAGEKAYETTGKWLPEETLDTIREYKDRKSTRLNSSHVAISY